MEILTKRKKRWVEPVNICAQEISNREIYTFFCRGRIIELPTRWLRFLSWEPRYSKQTVYQYAANLKNLLTWFTWTEEYKELSLDTVLRCCKRGDLQHWIRWQRETGKSPRTIRSREATVKEFFCWLGSEDGGRIRTAENALYKTGKLISPAGGKKRPRYLSPEAMIVLLNGFHNESERCLAHVMFDVGLRISEAVRLNRADLPEEREYAQGAKYLPLKVPGSKGRGGTINERISIVSSPVLARIRRYHNSPEYRFSPNFSPDNLNKPLFLGVNGSPLSPRNFNKQIKSAAVRAGLNPRDFSAHKFRHGAAYSILKSELGNDYIDRLVLVQQVFGHRQIRTTEIYASLPPAILDQLNNSETAVSKYEEAKRIFDATYLPPKQHIEHRGHR